MVSAFLCLKKEATFPIIQLLHAPHTHTYARGCNGNPIFAFKAIPTVTMLMTFKFTVYHSYITYVNSIAGIYRVSINLLKALCAGFKISELSGNVM